MRKIIVGDIHGCIKELDDMIQTLDLVPTDTFISVGDLVDKGQDSAGVVARVRELREKCKVVLVKGNHEDKHYRYRRHLRRLHEQGIPIPMKTGVEEVRTITDALTKKDIDFLETAVLYHKLPDYRALVVHAGVPPTVTYLPPLADIDRMDRKKADKYRQLLRVRHVNLQGYMVPLGDEKPEDVYWADLYDGRFGTVYYGHHPYLQGGPKVHPHSIGLDLGCVYGGHLAAQVLDGDHTEIVLVKAHAKYASGLWDE